MFTGIIENRGEVISLENSGTGRVFYISSPLSHQLKVDQSLAHDGVCLTIEEVKGDTHRVTAVQETLEKTNLLSWEKGTSVNLERCMQMNGRLDGHLVQGHVDTRGTCISVIDRNGSWEYRFSFPQQFASLMIEKGSVCVNGISLTAFNVNQTEFSVAIIPYTFHHTNISLIRQGDAVNLEFDLIGKYIQRNLQLSSA